MSNPFDRIDRLCGASIERAFSEPVRFMPQLASEYVSAADPARQAFDLMAVVTVDHAPERIDGDAKVVHSTPYLVGGEVRISVDTSFFAADPPRKGDRFKALKRPGQPVFAVKHSAPDNATRILLHCAKVNA